MGSGWILPGDGDNTLLRGFEKTICTHAGSHASHKDVSQVSATVRFEIGEANMVKGLQFKNMTAAVSVEKKVDTTDDYRAELQTWLAAHRNQQFHFKVTLTVPEGYEPLSDQGGSYFTLNVYDTITGICVAQKKLYVHKDADGAWIGEIDLYNGQRADVVMAPPDDGKTLYAHYYTTNPETQERDLHTIEITSRDQITYINDSSVPVYSTPVYDEMTGEEVYLRLYYLRDGIDISDSAALLEESWICVENSEQIRIATKQVGATISHKNGYTLQYKSGTRYLDLPTDLSAVDLHLAMVDDVYQVCAQIDSPLYYFPAEDEPLQRITSWEDLMAAVESPKGVWCELDGVTYSVELTEIDDEGGKTYEGIHWKADGCWLMVNCPVYAIQGSDLLPVFSLNDILIHIDTINVPVSSEVIRYEFEETWREDDWGDDWDSDNERPKIFFEDWAGRSGIAETGTLKGATIVNWYKDMPGGGYLAITEDGGDPNESFLYRITNKRTGKSMIVSVKGGDVTYVYAPLGEYIIEEITDWAWRYEDGECVYPATGTSRATVTVTSANDTPATAVHADFTNERNDKGWLGDESSIDNQFTGSAAADANSRKQEYAMPAVSYDLEKKRQDQEDNQ